MEPRSPHTLQQPHRSGNAVSEGIVAPGRGDGSSKQSPPVPVMFHHPMTGGWCGFPVSESRAESS